MPTALDKEKETTRVIVLGDSQLDGTVADNENMTSILEAELAAKGKQYEILNAATGRAHAKLTVSQGKTRAKIKALEIIEKEKSAS